MKLLVPTRAVAFARVPAVNPAETRIQATSRISVAARPIGMEFPPVRFAPCA